MKYKNRDYNLDVLFHRQKYLEMHRKKLEDIIVEKKDYKEEFKHIQNIEQFKNLKQRTIQFNEREKQVQIQRENDILLTKLLDIQMKPAPKPQSRSLGAEYNVSSIKHHKNFVKMKNEIIGVIQKNDQIAKRIINQQSTIKHQEFQKDYEKSQYYKKIITRFNSNMQSENTLNNLKGSEFHLNAFKKSQKYMQNSPSHFQVSPVRIRSSSPHKENQQEKSGSYSPQRFQTAQSQSSANQNQNVTSSHFYNPVKTYKYNPNSSSNKSVLEKSQTQQSFFRATSPKSKNIRNELNNSNIVIKKVVSQKGNKNLNQSCLKGNKKQINIDIPAKKVIQILDEQSPVSPYVEVLVNKYLIQKEIDENKDQMQALVLNQKQNQQSPKNNNKKQLSNSDQQQIATVECQKNIKKIVEEQKSQKQIMEQIVEEAPTVNSEHEISQKQEEDKQISQTSSKNLFKKETDSDSQPNRSHLESQQTVKTYTEIKTFENNLDLNLENNLEYLHQQQVLNKNQSNSKAQIDKHNQRQANFSNSYQTADFNNQNKLNESQQKSELSQIIDAENSQIMNKCNGVKVKSSKLLHHTAKSVGYDEKQNRWKKKQESEEYQNQEHIEYEEYNNYGIEGEQDEDAKEDLEEDDDENEYDDCDEDLEGNEDYEQTNGNNLQSDIEENLIQDEENTQVKSEKLSSDSYNNKKSKTNQSSKPNISRKNSSSFQVDEDNNYKNIHSNQRVGSLSQTSKNSKVQNSSEIQTNQCNNSEPLLQQQSDKNLKTSNKQSDKDIQEEIEID